MIPIHKLSKIKLTFAIVFFFSSALSVAEENFASFQKQQQKGALTYQKTEQLKFSNYQKELKEGFKLYNQTYQLEFKKYKQQYPIFRYALKTDNFGDMWKELDEIFEWKDC